MNDRVGGAHNLRAARLPVVAVIGALLIAGALADRAGSSHAAPALPVIQPMPVAPPASALSAEWFCAGASGRPHQQADGALVVANASDRTLRGTAMLVPSQGRSVTIPFRVGPYASATLSEAYAGDAPFVGALVQLDGGAAAVEQVVTGAQGVSTSACATTGSDHWYFADGTTQENASLFISLINPYPEDAIADLSFSTEQGSESPADFQGVVVPAHGLIGLDVGAHLRLRTRVATTVSVRAGRVAAFKTQVATSPPAAAASPPPDQVRVPGLSLVLGAPAPVTEQWWAAGLAAPGVTERYQIYNPSQTRADVSLRIALDEGSADPFALTVPRNGTVTVVSDGAAGIPSGVGHAAELVSTNGIGVVAERTVDAAGLATEHGLADARGSTLRARRWLLAAGPAGPGFGESVAVYNPANTAVHVSASSLGGELAPVSGLSDLTLPPGRRLVVPVSDRSSPLDRSLVVRATGNVIVERELARASGMGIDATVGIPLPDAP